MSERAHAETANPMLRTLLEAIASHMGMDRGRCLLEARFLHGELLHVHLHEGPVVALELERRFSPDTPDVR